MENLKVTVTKTADGASDYIQIMSSDMVSVNVVLIADVITVDDMREGEDVQEKGQT